MHQPLRLPNLRKLSPTMAQVPQDVNVADVQGVLAALDDAVPDNQVAAQAAPSAAADPVSFLVLFYSFQFVSNFVRAMMLGDFC